MQGMQYTGRYFTCTLQRIELRDKYLYQKIGLSAAFEACMDIPYS